MSMVYESAKRTFDVAFGASVLLATAPVTIPVAAAIRLTMGSPVLFRQTRPGLRGEPFQILKFRTMRNLKPGEDMLATDGDRITALGHFLRNSSIDELPTFLNVVRGEMSVVGPRPLLMRYLSRYTERQARRHEVKPGITGWAQIHGRNLLSWEERFEHDVWYVEHRSLLLDMKIIALTLARVIERDGISAEGVPTMTEFMGYEAA